MNESSITVENVRDLEANNKRSLEDILGQRLHENQQVFIMVFSPGVEPDDAARHQAKLGLEATFQKTTAYADKHGISEEEIEAAIQEARQQVRPTRE